MEKRKTFHGRQVGKKRLLPIVFPLFLFLLIPLNGYGDDTPMPEVVQQNSTRITGVVKDAYGEPVIGANVKVVGTTQGTITDFEGKFSINVSGASAKIKISFIGYKDKEVTAKKGVSLNNDEGFGQCIWLNLALGSNGGEPDLSKFPLEYHVDYVRVYQFE